jgi:hypothetical protein
MRYLIAKSASCLMEIRGLTGVCDIPGNRRQCKRILMDEMKMQT